MPEEVECANCGKKYSMSDYEHWCLIILKDKPACSRECRQALSKKKKELTDATR